MHFLVRGASEKDLPLVVDLLHKSGLPSTGLEDHVETLLVAVRDERIVGCAALELYGEYALLRSVAVHVSNRGVGVGVLITNEVVRLARSKGVRRLYLLTETASAYFPRLGFRIIPRSGVPAPVTSSVEFTHVCPESALVMELLID